MPIFHRLKVYTAYEFLETRFDVRTRTLAAGLFLLQRGLSTGLTIYAPALILSVLLGATSMKLEASQQLQIVRSEYESLRSLPPSSGDRSTLDQFLSAMRGEVSALTSNKAAIEQGGDTATAQSRFANAKSSAETAARSYGFKDCAKGAAPSSSSTATTAAPTTTTPAVPVPTTPPPVAPAPPAGGTGGTGGAPTGGGTSGGSGGGSGGSGGVSP